MTEYEKVQDFIRLIKEKPVYGRALELILRNLKPTGRINETPS